MLTIGLLHLLQHKAVLKCHDTVVSHLLRSAFFFKIEPRLELWPGYTTSIMPYETEVLLSADVSHKVLRQTTVLEYLYELYNTVNQRDFHSTATKKLVGQIILTRYS